MGGWPVRKSKRLGLVEDDTDNMVFLWVLRKEARSGEGSAPW